jgi:hypothetical protein
MSADVRISDHVRRQIWDLLEANARIGNLKPGNIRGNGMPDLLAKLIIEDIAGRIDGKPLKQGPVRNGESK